MKSPVILFLLISVSQANAFWLSSSDTSDNMSHDEAFLKFRKGDIIACRIHLLAYHYYLAVDNINVAHIHGDHLTGKGSIDIENFNTTTPTYYPCHIEYRGNYNINGINAKKAVKRVRRDIRIHRKRFHFHLITCNCEHWVRHWREGKSYSCQSLLSSSSSCPIWKKIRRLTEL